MFVLQAGVALFAAITTGVVIFVVTNNELCLCVRISHVEWLGASVTLHSIQLFITFSTHWLIMLLQVV